MAKRHKPVEGLHVLVLEPGLGQVHTLATLPLAAGLPDLVLGLGPVEHSTRPTPLDVHLRRLPLRRVLCPACEDCWAGDQVRR